MPLKILLVCNMFFLTHININHSHHFYHTLVSLIQSRKNSINARKHKQDRKNWLFLMIRLLCRIYYTM